VAVYANLMGRLGNQMFIYAFARAIQEEMKGENEIVYSGNIENRLANYNVSLRYVNSKPSYTLLQRFLSVFYSRHISNQPVLRRHRLECKISSIYSSHNLFYLEHGYQSFCVGYEKNASIWGYFQSEKFFAPIKEKIKQEFTPKSDEMASTEAYALLQNARSVCVSIRLGDYMKHPVHGVCTVDYYVRAMKMMQEKLGNPLFYVSTEDPSVIQNMPEFSQFEMIFEDSQLQDWQKMFLTNQCTNFILSNSTFSWWGYYLSQNREKNHGITIAPNRWFNTDIPCDIYMDDWVLIQP